MAVATPVINYASGVSNGGTTVQKTMGFTWTETGADVAYRYNTRLDTPAGNGSWSADQTAMAQRYSSLTATGSYTFNVRAKDGNGNLSSVATWSWTLNAPSSSVPSEPNVSAPALQITTPSVTVTFTEAPFGGGGTPVIQFGWGEGHMESFSANELANAMAVQKYVFKGNGVGSFVRSNMTKQKTQISTNMSNSSWSNLTPFITTLSSNRFILYPTFSLTNTDPVPPTSGSGSSTTMPAWSEMIRSGLQYLCSLIGVVPGFVMPPAVEIVNEPGNQGTGGGGLITPTQLYYMCREASKAIAAWNASAANTSGINVVCHGPGLAGAGAYGSLASDARNYATKVYDAAIADGHHFSDWCLTMGWHTYYVALGTSGFSLDGGSTIHDPGSGMGHTQNPKSLIYTRADMDQSKYGMQLGGSHPLYQHVSEGGFKDNDTQNAWVGFKDNSYVYETNAAANAGPAGAFAAEWGLPAAWTYMVNNAATLGIVHINQYRYIDHNAASVTPNPSNHEELGLGRNTSGTVALSSLVERAKATSLKAYLATL